MTLREHIQVFRRAVKWMSSISRRYTLLLVVSSSLSAAVVYVPIYFSARVIDALVARAPVGTALFYAALTVGIVFAVQLLNGFLSSEKDAAFNMVWIKEEWSYSEKAMQMAYRSIEDPEVTKLRYRTRLENQTGQNLFYLYRDVELFTWQATKIASSLALTASFFTVSSVLAAWKLFIVAGVAATMAVRVYVTKRLNGLNRDFTASSVHMNILGECFNDYIGSYEAGKDIRLYDMGGFLADADLALNREYWGRNLENSYRKAAWTVPVTILDAAFKFGIYAVLIYAAMQGGVSTGSIAKYVACIMLLVETMANVVETFQKSLDNNHYLQRYFSYFDIPNTMYKGSLTVEKRDDNECDVEFRDVSFKYPNTQAYALKNVNLKFKVGEKLAIVGKNGSGKTTFLKLLCRLYDPTQGEILLNGVNIQKYDYEEYMSIFSVVFQDFNLFSLMLGEVVASSRDFEEEKVRECLRKANFGDRLEEMPDGVRSYLYKRYDRSGIEVSGGEAQKIALARALYKDSPFILLDEPTAALDPISEYEVYSNFNEISGDKTTVYISHRLASCRFCDKVAVFDEGRIVQTGRHEQLLAEGKGKYYELWNAQAQYYRRESRP